MSREGMQAAKADVAALGAEVAKTDTKSKQFANGWQGMVQRLVQPSALLPSIATVGALGGGLLAAGLGAAAFGAVAIPVLKNVTQVMKDQAAAAVGGTAARVKYLNDLKSMSPAAFDLMGNMKGLSTAWSNFNKSVQPQVVSVLNNGISVLRAQIPFLAPLVNNAATAFNGLIIGLGNAAKSQFWTQFRTQLTALAGPAITSIGQTVGNLVTGLAGIIKLFLPLVMPLLGALGAIAAGFATFGKALTSSNPAAKIMTATLLGLAGAFTAVKLATIAAGWMDATIAWVAKMSVALRGMAAAEAVTATESATMATAMTAALGPIGIAVAVIGGLTYAIAKFSPSAKEAAKTASDLAQGFLKVAQAGQASSIRAVDTTKGFTDAGRALADMVRAGHVTEAAKAFAALNKQAKLDAFGTAGAHWADAYKTALQGVTGAAKAVTPAQALVNSALKAAQDAASKAANAITDFGNAVAGLIDPQIAASNAAITMADGLVTLKTALHASRGAMGLQTAASRASLSAFNTQIQSLDTFISAQQKLPGGIKASMPAINAQIAILSRLAGRNSYARAMVQQLRDMIATLQSKTVVVTTVIRQIQMTVPHMNSNQGKWGGFAAGGAVGSGIHGYASGGNLAMVGENGPELVRLPYGSSVNTAGDTQRMMGQGGGSSQKIQLEWVGGQAGDELFKWIKKNIRVRAGSGTGNVQRALG